MLNEPAPAGVFSVTRAEKVSAAWTQERRDQHGAMLSAKWTEERRAKAAEARRRLWRDPVYVERVRAGRAKVDRWRIPAEFKAWNAKMRREGVPKAERLRLMKAAEAAQ